ncbi:hypothetical protein BKA69DRAFT_858684 [Paraphysoderma sedebokerense]|nr:hypothetical protein BKA69DRAFT_858684 [Paraphysoderma sedebokerense]
MPALRNLPSRKKRLQTNSPLSRPSVISENVQLQHQENVEERTTRSHHKRNIGSEETKKEEEIHRDGLNIQSERPKRQRKAKEKKGIEGEKENVDREKHESIHVIEPERSKRGRRIKPDNKAQESVTEDKMNDSKVYTEVKNLQPKRGRRRKKATGDPELEDEQPIDHKNEKTLSKQEKKTANARLNEAPCGSEVGGQDLDISRPKRGRKRKEVTVGDQIAPDAGIDAENPNNDQKCGKPKRGRKAAREGQNRCTDNKANSEGKAVNPPSPEFISDKPERGRKLRNQNAGNEKQIGSEFEAARSMKRKNGYDPIAVAPFETKEGDNTIAEIKKKETVAKRRGRPKKVTAESSNGSVDEGKIEIQTDEVSNMKLDTDTGNSMEFNSPKARGRRVNLSELEPAVQSNTSVSTITVPTDSKFQRQPSKFSSKVFLDVDTMNQSSTTSIYTLQSCPALPPKDITSQIVTPPPISARLQNGISTAHTQPSHRLFSITPVQPLKHHIGSLDRFSSGQFFMRRQSLSKSAVEIKDANSTQPWDGKIDLRTPQHLILSSASNQEHTGKKSIHASNRVTRSHTVVLLPSTVHQAAINDGTVEMGGHQTPKFALPISLNRNQKTDIRTKSNRISHTDLRLTNSNECDRINSSPYQNISRPLKPFQSEIFKATAFGRLYRGVDLPKNICYDISPGRGDSLAVRRRLSRNAVLIPRLRNSNCSVPTTENQSLQLSVSKLTCITGSKTNDVTPSVLIIQRAWRAWQHKNKYLHNEKLRIEAASRIQNWYRSRLLRQKYLKMLRAVMIIQSFWRMTLGKLKYRRIRNGIIKLQLVWKKVTSSRSDMKEKAALRIQSWWRGFVVRQKLKEENHAATLLQNWWRMCSRRQRFLKVQQAAIHLQRRWRRQLLIRHTHRVLSVLKIQSWWLQRRWYMERLRRIIVLQSWWRAFQQRKRYDAYRTSAVRLQSWWRKIQQQRSYQMQYSRKVIRIQSWWRMVQDKKSFNSCRTAIIKIQSWYRCQSARTKFQRIRSLIIRSQSKFRTRRSSILNAAIVLQSFFRMLHQQRRYRYSLQAIIRLQSVIRGHQARILFSKAFAALIALQATFRMLSKRKQYMNLKRMSVFLQTRWRFLRKAKQKIVGQRSANVAENVLSVEHDLEEPPQSNEKSQELALKVLEQSKEMLKRVQEMKKRKQTPDNVIEICSLPNRVFASPLKRTLGESRPCKVDSPKSPDIANVPQGGDDEDHSTPPISLLLPEIPDVASAQQPRVFTRNSIKNPSFGPTGIPNKRHKLIHGNNASSTLSATSITNDPTITPTGNSAALSILSGAKLSKLTKSNTEENTKYQTTKIKKVVISVDIPKPPSPSSRKRKERDSDDESDDNEDNENVMGGNSADGQPKKKRVMWHRNREEVKIFNPECTIDSPSKAREKSRSGMQKDKLKNPMVHMPAKSCLKKESEIKRQDFIPQVTTTTVQVFHYIDEATPEKKYPTLPIIRRSVSSSSKSSTSVVLPLTSPDGNCSDSTKTEVLLGIESPSQSKQDGEGPKRIRVLDAFTTAKAFTPSSLSSVAKHPSNKSTNLAIPTAIPKPTSLQKHSIGKLAKPTEFCFSSRNGKAKSTSGGVGKGVAGPGRIKAIRSMTNIAQFDQMLNEGRQSARRGGSSGLSKSTGSKENAVKIFKSGNLK